MIELPDDIPFLWRLSAQSSDGFCSVSMVVQCPPGTDIEDVTIETTVLSLSSDSTRSEQEETLEWNQDDFSLFLKLVNHQQGGGSGGTDADTSLRIDLSDPDIIDIVNVVAAAGFGVAFTPFGLIHPNDSKHPVYDFDIGSFASLDTTGGYKACIVVDVEDDNVICVLLDDIDIIQNGYYDSLTRHDLLLVSRNDVLHPEYAESIKIPPGAVLH